MSFLKKVEARYETIAAMSWKEDLAFTLLTSAFADEVERNPEDHGESKTEDHRHYERLLNEISRGELTDNLESMIDDYKLDVKKYLPLKLIDSIDASMKKQTDMGLEDLYEENEYWAHGAVMHALGHGVSETDDPDFEDWYKEKTGKDWEWGFHTEGPYDEAWELVKDMSEKIDEEDK